MLSPRDLQIYFLRFTVISVLYTIVKHVIIDFSPTKRPLIGGQQLVSLSVPVPFADHTSFQRHGDRLTNSSVRWRQNDDGSTGETKVSQLVGSDVIAMRLALVIDNKTSDFTKLFGSKCPTDKLGLPAQVARTCGLGGGNSSSPSGEYKPHCERLTCRNIIYDIAAADNLSRIASQFTASHPVHFPTDRDLAALSGNKCDSWRRLYGFNELPPITEEEADFPLAFNILAHQDAHQVCHSNLVSVSVAGLNGILIS